MDDKENFSDPSKIKSFNKTKNPMVENSFTRSVQVGDPVLTSEHFNSKAFDRDEWKSIAQSRLDAMNKSATEEINFKIESELLEEQRVMLIKELDATKEMLSEVKKMMNDFKTAMK